MKFKKVRSILLVLALSCSMIVTPVLAAPTVEEATAAADQAAANQANLESQKASAQGEVSALQNQLNSLMTKMNELETQLIENGQKITQAEADLQVAEEKEQQQYEDLKLRIKYMYEEGEGSALERILSSGSIAEVLTQAEYVQKVHEYDRDQLEVYQETVNEVAELKQTLETDRANLQSLESQYQSQSEELNNTINSKSSEIANLDSMIQEAARVAVEASQAKAAAEQKAAEEAAKQNQVNNNNPAGGGTGTNSGGTTNTPAPEETPTPDAGGNTAPTPEPDPAPQPNYDVNTGNAIVDRAYSWVGNAEYVWGACSPGAFDCSGFVSYCLTGAYSRLGTTYTFLTLPQVSDPQPGDVCVNADHCGIYIGGGQMIHAATYGVGVIVGPVQSGMIYVRY